MENSAPDQYSSGANRGAIARGARRRSPVFNLLRRVLRGEAEGSWDGRVGSEGAEGGKRGADAEEAAELRGGVVEDGRVSGPETACG